MRKPVKISTKGETIVDIRKVSKKLNYFKVFKFFIWNFEFFK